MTERYLEDFEAGQTFRSPRIRIDAERIKSFAAEFDPQPFHLDERAAADSIFRSLAASGWHTAAITMRLLVEGDLKPAGGIDTFQQRVQVTYEILMLHLGITIVRGRHSSRGRPFRVWFHTIYPLCRRARPMRFMILRGLCNASGTKYCSLQSQVSCFLPTIYMARVHRI